MIGPWHHWDASRMPSTQACASASTALEQLKRARQAVSLIFPVLSLATTPVPAQPVAATKEASTFNFTHPSGGLTHVSGTRILICLPLVVSVLLGPFPFFPSSPAGCRHSSRLILRLSRACTDSVSPGGPELCVI